MNLKELLNYLNNYRFNGTMTETYYVEKTFLGFAYKTDRKELIRKYMYNNFLFSIKNEKIIWVNQMDNKPEEMLSFVLDKVNNKYGTHFIIDNNYIIAC